MKLDATQEALLAIVERRNQAVAERDRLAAKDMSYGWAHEAGIVAGLCIALDALKEAGLPVASAEYIAAGGRA